MHAKLIQVISSLSFLFSRKAISMQLALILKLKISPISIPALGKIKCIGNAVK
jgi:hypothetical protein